MNCGEFWDDGQREGFEAQLDRNVDGIVSLHEWHVSFALYTFVRGSCVA